MKKTVDINKNIQYIIHKEQQPSFGAIRNKEKKMETVSVETFDKDGLQCGSVVFDTEDFDLKAYPVVVYRPVAYFLLSVWNEEKWC